MVRGDASTRSRLGLHVATRLDGSRGRKRCRAVHRKYGVSARRQPFPFHASPRWVARDHSTRGGGRAHRRAISAFVGRALLPMRSTSPRSWSITDRIPSWDVRGVVDGQANATRGDLEWCITGRRIDEVAGLWIVGRLWGPSPRRGSKDVVDDTRPHRPVERSIQAYML